MAQVRNFVGEIRDFETLKEAFEDSLVDLTVWKISCLAATGELIRLIKTDEGWVYEDILGNRHLPPVEEKYPVGTKVAFSHRGLNFVGVVSEIQGTTYQIKTDYPYPNEAFAIHRNSIKMVVPMEEDSRNKGKKD